LVRKAQEFMVIAMLLEACLSKDTDPGDLPQPCGVGRTGFSARRLRRGAISAKTACAALRRPRRRAWGVMLPQA
jgi:hypothetical protein